LDSLDTATRGVAPESAVKALTVQIGEISIRLHPESTSFNEPLSDRFFGFLTEHRPVMAADLDVLLAGRDAVSDREISVSRSGPLWRIERGDFLAEWNPLSRRGWVKQSANPHPTDTVLRIVHSLLLAEEGGFLLHASSAVRNGRAFLFAGVSGAGKTTIAHLAPQDAVLLTDEISYIRPNGEEYRAYGTPFAGSLQKPGENIFAPVACAFLLEKGLENRIDDVDVATAARSLLRNVLFFARDTELASRVFEGILDFVSRVPVKRLIFEPDERVWELIR